MEEFKIKEFEKKSIICTILCEYIVHGSLNGFSSDKEDVDIVYVDAIDTASYKFMEKIKEVSDVEGTVHFDSLQSVHYSDGAFWYIKVADPNTQDRIHYDDMFEILKKQDSQKPSEGKKILFSGTIWRWLDAESPSIHNTGYNIVVISDVDFIK